MHLVRTVRTSACHYYKPVSACLSLSNSLDRPMSKRCTNLSTCVLGKLSQDIHKLQTYPRTDVGAGTPGKKRSLPEHYANYGDSFNWIWGDSFSLPTPNFMGHLLHLFWLTSVYSHLTSLPIHIYSYMRMLMYVDPSCLTDYRGMLITTPTAFISLC